MKMAHYPQTCGTYFHTDQKPLCFLGCAALQEQTSTDTVLFLSLVILITTYLDFKLTSWKNIVNFLCKRTGITPGPRLMRIHLVRNSTSARFEKNPKIFT